MDFVTFREFSDEERAGILVQTLQENKIEYKIVEDRASLDSLYGDKHFHRRFFVQIKQQDFAQADTILQQQSDAALETVDKDHYLFEFSDVELLDVLSKPDEWNDLDYQLAKKILRERGKDVSDDTIAILKKRRIEELARPDSGSKTWIYIGYILSLLGGLLGVFIGLILMTSKKTLPDGQNVYSYSPGDRRHGVRILTIGIVVIVAILVSRIQEFKP